MEKCQYLDRKKLQDGITLNDNVKILGYHVHDEQCWPVNFVLMILHLYLFKEAISLKYFSSARNGQKKI